MIISIIPERFTFAINDAWFNEITPVVKIVSFESNKLKLTIHL
jgi:hypothetical protein